MKGSGKPTRRDKSTLLLIYEHTSLAREHSHLHAAIVVTASIILFVDKNEGNLHFSIIK